MSNEIVLSVIVCTYNGEMVLASCLSSLINQSFPKDKYEILVIDNNSSDNSFKIANEYQSKYNIVHVFHELILGASNARNRGIFEARGNYIAFIDDDAKAKNDWCSNIVSAFSIVKPTPIAVGGIIYPYLNVNNLPKWYDDTLEIRSWGSQKRFLNSHDRYFSGSNMSFSKHILMKYNGFSPNIGPKGSRFAVGEESELFNRILKKESFLLWYDPTIIVYHLVKKDKLVLRNRLERARCAGIHNYRQNSHRRINLFWFSFNRAVFYLLKCIYFIIFLRFDSNLIICLQKLVSKLTTIRLIIVNLGSKTEQVNDE